MKIAELIDIIEIKNNGIPFLAKEYGCQPQNELTIYSSSDGICYYKDANIGFLNTDKKCKDKVYEITKKLSQNIRGLDEKERELNKFLAVTELLIAVDKFKGGSGSFKINQVKDYVSRINKKIVESLKFDDIQDIQYIQAIQGIHIQNRKDLISTIKDNEFYREQYFNVTEVYCNKEERRYCFGNKYHEELDVVDITIYNNRIKLIHRGEGKVHDWDLDLKEQKSIEAKILLALGSWRGTFLK